MIHNINKFALTCVTVACIGFAPTTSMAALGDNLVASGGTITATFQGSDAGYDSLLRVTAPGGYDSGYFFPNHSTSVGSTFNLGSFVAGTPLDLQLYVLNTGNTWHVGSASGNADNVIHANVVYDYPTIGSTFVGFEDLWGGGDYDYNDHMFIFTNVSAVPELESYVMLIAGLGLLGFIARRRVDAAV